MRSGPHDEISRDQMMHWLLLQVMLCHAMIKQDALETGAVLLGSPVSRVLSQTSSILCVLSSLIRHGEHLLVTPSFEKRRQKDQKFSSKQPGLHDTVFQ